MDKSELKSNIQTERLRSLDVLRGFDMFWIIGGSSLVAGLVTLSNINWLQPVASQMEHVSWEGFHFYDLIFPLFMFISGVAIPYAIKSKLEKGHRRISLQRKIITRGILLVVFGIIYNGALKNGFSEARYASVLGQIGLAYLFAASIVLHVKSIKFQLLWFFLILCAIAVIQLIVPVPGYGAGLLDPVKGINAWLDQLLLPGKFHGGTYDPEGILCIISATTVTLMGSFAGNILRSPVYTQNRKTIFLLFTGIFLVLIALLLSPVYPIIKRIWTVPYNLLSGGISFILLSIFYYLADVVKFRCRICSGISFFFKVIGINSITIYLANRIIPFYEISRFFMGWLINPLGEWVILLGIITVEWLLLYYLYKRNIFLRV